MSKILKIHPADNVYVARQEILAGEEFMIDGSSIRSKVLIGRGHKIAAENMGEGQSVIKFGIPIGSATAPIHVGDHIHLHNLKSSYISTFTLDHEFIKK